MRRPMPPLAALLCAISLAGCAPASRRVQTVTLPNLGRLPTFSHATVAGDLVFVSGTLGTQGAGTLLVSGGVGAETAQALGNIETILEGAGASLRDVAKCTVYLLDLADFPAMNEAWRVVFPSEPPARTTVAVKELVLEARVEVDCVALRHGAEPR